MPDCPRPHQSQQGFTLLESIVALVIVATAGMALFSWLSSSLSNLRHAADVSAEISAKENIIEFMRTINPMLTPEGDMLFGPYQIHWSSKAIISEQDNANYPNGIGLYKIGLFQTKITTSRPEAHLWFEFTLKQVGYWKARKKINPFEVQPKPPQ